MEGTLAYQYSPLANSDSIRLLLLHPGLPGSEIYCSLIHTTLSECHCDIYQHYTALSYVWGDATQRRGVILDGRTFQVTVNLAAALDDLRHPHHDLRLWADAICIDQSNISERNHQVGLMRDIYSFAQHTIIYLGESDRECDEAVEMATSMKLDFDTRDVVTTRILSRPWFTRVWTYQELVLSRDPWVQSGRKRIRWELLYNALRRKDEEVSYDSDSSGTDIVIYTNDSHEPKELSNEGRLFRIFSDMHSARNSKANAPTLFSVMISRRGFGVSDLRDLVFGHLAVAQLPSKKNIPPCPVVDYQRNAVEVFTEATIYMAKKSKDNEIFLHVDVWDPDLRLKGLPSWVPDWSLNCSEILDPIDGIQRIPDRQHLKHHSSITALGLFRNAEFPTSTICSLRCLKIDILRTISDVSIPPMAGDVDQESYGSEIEGVRGFWGDHRYSSKRLTDRLGLYRDVHRVFEELLGENILSRLPPKNDQLSQRYEFITLWGQRRLSVRGRRECEFSYRPSPKSVEDYLMRHGLHIDSPSVLIGRKIAVLPGGGLAIVPPTTRPGDELYAFMARENFHILVLRPYLDAKDTEVDDSGHEATHIDNEEWKNIGHFTLVGCGWIESNHPTLSHAWSLREAFIKKVDDLPEIFRGRRLTVWLH